MENHRQTNFKLFGTCEEAYRLTVDEGHGGTTSAADFGTMLHFYNECMVDNKEWDGGEYKDVDQTTRYELAQAWALVEPKLKGITDLVTERNYYIDRIGKDCNLDRAFMGGQIDLWGVNGDVLEGIDYKGGKSGWWFEIQPIWYSLLLAPIAPKGIKTIRFRIMHPRHLDSEGEMKVIERKYPMRRMSVLFEKVKYNIELMEGQIQLKREGVSDWKVTGEGKAQCRRCFVKKFCKRKKEVK